MAQYQGKGYAAKLTSSMADKKTRQDTVQKIIQEVKNSKKELAEKSSVNDLEVKTEFKVDSATKPEAFRRNIRNHAINSKYNVSLAYKAMDSKRKVKNRKDFSRRKIGDRKNKSSSSSPFKIYQGFTHDKQPSALNSFNESTLPTDGFSLLNYPEKSRQDETFELVTDEKGSYTISPYDGPYDHNTSRAKTHRNGLRQAELKNQYDQTFDDGIDSLAVHRNGCGIPWSWSGRQKGRHKQLMGIPGKRFSCGFPATSRRNSVSRTVNSLHCQEPIQFESSTDSELVSSDNYLMEETPLIDLSYDNELSFDSSLDGHCDFPPKGCFGELDLHSFARTYHRTKKSSSRERKPKKETIHTRINEEIFMHGSLSQKYRPKSFKELVGQKMVAQALSNAIATGKMAPVYVFHGPIGTGKTSTARIFASALNCVSDGNAKPCGNCRGCSMHPEIIEIDAATSDGSIESMRILLQSIIFSQSVSQYKVFIVDECHLLTPEAWTVLLNGLDEGSRSAVFIMITTDSTKLPRFALSRCQNFCFPKLKDTDMFEKLEKIAAAENIDIEENALRLITSKADGSLRDAETTLDQLGLLGTRVTAPMVRQLVGLIPNDKLVDLLDLALSADTVKTVRSTREIIDSGIEPLALVAQLASLITDILAGSYIKSAWLEDNTRLFGGHYSSRHESDRLRQALKILSETEKQLRSSNDQTTWLTAALLQFAPDDFYLFPTSALRTSITQSPVALLDTSEKETAGLEYSVAEQPWHSDDQWKQYQLQLELRPVKNSGMITDTNSTVEISALPNTVCDFPESSNNYFPDHNNVHHRTHSSGHSQKLGVIFEDLSTVTESDNLPANSIDYSGDISEIGQKEIKLINPSKLEEIWQKVLEGIHSTDLTELLHRRGKLVSVSISQANAIAHLMFRHPEYKEQAERSELSLQNAFQRALGCPVEVKLRLGPSVEELEISESVDFTSNQKGMPYCKQKKLLTSKTERRQNSRAVRNVLPYVRKRNRVVGMFSKLPETSDSQPDTLQGGSHNDETPKDFNLNQDSSVLSTRNNGAQMASNNEQTNGSQIEDTHLYAEDLQMQQRSSTCAGTLSFVQQADGSIEAYSQDLLFEHVNSMRKLGKGKSSQVDTSFFEVVETNNHPKVVNMDPKEQSRCSGLLCWNEIHVKQHKWRRRRVKFFLRFAPCTESNVAVDGLKLKRTN